MYLFITGENPVKSASGLGLIVIAIGILIPLQYNVFMTGECLFLQSDCCRFPEKTTNTSMKILLCGFKSSIEIGLLDCPLYI